MRKITDSIRWGIVATGWVAAKFAEACVFESKLTGKSRLVAVASRDAQKAAEFAKTWGIPRAYGSYEALLADPDIDVVYIATPHNFHASLSIAALKAGKAVLCEKPVSLTSAEFRPVVETARKLDLFFMEAMWMKFNPSFRKALEWIAEGRIGTPSYIRSDFFIKSVFNPASRYFDLALGGGALLDVGIYPVTCALVMAGNRMPDSISSIIRTGSTGVDLYNKAHLTWKSGKKTVTTADLSSAIDLCELAETRSAIILGDKGSIILPFFWMAEEVRLVDSSNQNETIFHSPFECNGYEYEIREVESCLRKGKSESSVQTWADSIMVMDILDKIRMEAKDE